MNWTLWNARYCEIYSCSRALFILGGSCNIGAVSLKAWNTKICHAAISYKPYDTFHFRLLLQYWCCWLETRKYVTWQIPRNQTPKIWLNGSQCQPQNKSWQVLKDLNWIWELDNSKKSQFFKVIDEIFFFLCWRSLWIFFSIETIPSLWTSMTAIVIMSPTLSMLLLWQFTNACTAAKLIFLYRSEQSQQSGQIRPTKRVLVTTPFRYTEKNWKRLKTMILPREMKILIMNEEPVK